ncbi:AAA family ATPase [Nannocystis sp. ILAH1]|uniref:AAA family ATPase n=1 Tax=unclassified Nannocystis TaxID=2627009 RepID=UPI002270CF9C|nr:MULTISPECIES: AAA family ATPase [unclassified Nannocystis]MCY0990458.1 AAA family ATPase [Nannocystis sp. ILAH1]MCY1069254.1 AAA family ATPase [Nannocystis sp. RBIL2]
MTRTADKTTSPVFVSLLWHTMAETSSQDQFVLERGKGRKWDDFGFKTLYSLYWLPAGAEAKQARYIGPIKILQSDDRSTVLPDRFAALSEFYCSLGQNPEYYENLQELGPELAQVVLVALRDIASDSEIEGDFAEQEGITVSLLRSVSARTAMNLARQRLHGVDADVAPAELTFRFTTTLSKVLPTPSAPYRLDVRLSARDGRLGRLMVLVGKNATGKSGLLSVLGQAVSGLDSEAGSIDPPIRGISRVIAISYSAFDPYRYFGKARPSTAVGYFYCGLRDHHGVINLKHAFDRSHRHLRQLDPRAWRDAIRASGLADEEPSLAAVLEEPDPSKLIELMETLSSGHKIFLFVLVNLLATIRPRALVLIDEPEIHLHPNLLSSLMRLLHKILDESDSFAVLATHSPQVLQEVPARYIRIVERVDGAPALRLYPGESFGANLGEIIRFAFGVDEKSANYFKILNSTLDEETLRRWYDHTLHASSLSLAPYTVLADRLHVNEEDDDETT